MFSCSYAFATIGAVEAHLKIRKNISVDLSEQRLIDCAYAKERSPTMTAGGCHKGFSNDGKYRIKYNLYTQNSFLNFFLKKI